MNASSESGEWASLISTGACSVFWVAGCPAMSIFGFLGKLPAWPAKKLSLPWVRSELEEENERDAGTCEAPCRVFFRSKSLTYRGHPLQLSCCACQRKVEMSGFLPY